MRALAGSVLALLLLTATARCGSGPARRCGPFDCPASDAAVTDLPPPDADPGDGAATDGPPALPTDFVALEVEPGIATLTSRNGERPTVQFRAVGVRVDRVRNRLGAATWSLSDDRVGAIDQAGLFTANGVAGGLVTVSATFTDPRGGVLRAEARLELGIAIEVATPGASTALATRFEGPASPDPAQAPRVVYPLADALLPGNVAPVDVQWDPVGQRTDVFRVRLARPHATVTGYLLNGSATFRHGWLVERGAWRSLAESDPGAALTITVDRLDARTQRVHPSAPVTIRLADGRVFGAVYYWDLTSGRVLRLNAVTAERENFLPFPPRAPGTGRRCVACHTISRDGRYLSAVLWEVNEPAAVFDLTADLSRDPSPTLFPPGSTRYFSASFSPDGTRLVVNHADSSLTVIDPRTGLGIRTTGLPARGVAHPEWSPDGREIALVANANNTDWADTFDRGDLGLVPRVATDTFGPVQVLHRGADLASRAEGGATDDRPTWSPDARFLAFQHGPRSRTVGANDSPSPSALYLVARTGGAALRLDRACDGPRGVETWWPTFSPFVVAEGRGRGTYYWLGFFSRRDYGNALAGTRGRHRRQLWVTAVDAMPVAGRDPSHVPYWLPGQDPNTENMAAYWAPLPCRANGSPCSVREDCCSGTCREESAGSARSLCRPPPPMDCHRHGQPCSEAADCCAGLLCTGNVCQPPPP